MTLRLREVYACCDRFWLHEMDAPAHAQHVITEHQRLVYTRPLPDKIHDISAVQRVCIVRAFDSW